MSNYFTKMALENDHYPIRMGQTWTEDETKQLLKSIHLKKHIKCIANEHQRTEGGIKSRLRFIACEYYFNDNLPIDTIMIYTGLNRIQIEDAIKKRESLEGAKKSTSVSKRTKEDDIVELLQQINDKLYVLIEKKKDKFKLE